MQLIMSLEILTRLHKQVFMSSQLPNKSFNYQTDWTRELELAGPGPAHLYQKQWNMFYPSRDKLVTSSCASQTRGILTIKCSSFSLLVAYSFLLAFLHFLFARNDLSPCSQRKVPWLAAAGGVSGQPSSPHIIMDGFIDSALAAQRCWAESSPTNSQ